MTAVVAHYNDLYSAQRAARAVTTQVSWFPCYSSEYIQSQSGTGRALLVTYSATYDALEAIGHVLSASLRRVIHVVEFVSGLIFRPFYFIYNAIYPINPINGERHFTLISRSLEKKLGDWILYPLGTALVVPTYDLLPNSFETMADRVDEVAQKIFKRNRALLNPPGETPFDYRTSTVTSSQINAASFAGGGMVVSSQTVKELHAAIQAQKIQETTIELPDGSSVVVDLREVTLDDALAGLIGHEITHAASRHDIVQRVAELLIGIPFSVVKVIFLVLFERKTIDVNSFSHHIQRFSAHLRSRRAEYEADVTGAYLAHRASFNPLGAIYVQELARCAESLPWLRKSFEFAFSHPYSKNRERAILAGIQSFAPETLKGHIFIEEKPEIPLYDTKRDKSARASRDLLEWVEMVKAY